MTAWSDYCAEEERNQSVSFGRDQPGLDYHLAMSAVLRLTPSCQGPWSVDLRTPPGQECSNGSLLDICYGSPGIFFFFWGFPLDL